MEIKGLSAPAAQAPTSVGTAQPAANMVEVVESTAQAQYSSPVMAFDGNTGLAVLRFRDGQSGEQEFQIPSKRTLEYAQQQRITEDDPARKAGFQA